MSGNETFDELLDAVSHLPPDEQAELVAVIQRRLAEGGRRRVAVDVGQGREEHEAGTATPVSADELIRELRS